MHCISPRTSLFSTLISKASNHTFTTRSAVRPNLQKLQQPAIPNHFPKGEVVLCQYHSGRGHVGASMKAKLYHLLVQRAADWQLNYSHFSSIFNAPSSVLAASILSFHCGGEMVIPQCLFKVRCRHFDHWHLAYMLSIENATHNFHKSGRLQLVIYKARGTQAALYFTVSFYTEFAESKDLVLIRRDVVLASKLSDEEAKWLVGSRDCSVILFE